jgi:hypothetical protein
MPWTRQQVKYLLSNGSPLTKDQEEKMKAELHANPSMGHMKKRSKMSKMHHSASAGDFLTKRLNKFI